MSLKSLVSGSLVFGMVMGLAAVVAPGASASHLSDPTRCTCSASLGFDKPLFQWSSEGLVFIPRVNFSVRSRGGSEAPPLNVVVNYGGETSYESGDVSVPAGVAFSGQKQVINGFPCNGSYRSSGVALTKVALTGLVRSLIGEDQELNGLVHMQASIEGCGFDEENRESSFRMREFGNLRIGGWRSVR